MIRSSDGDLKPGGPLGAYQQMEALGFTFSLPFTITPRTTHLHYKTIRLHIVTLISLLPIHKYRYTSLRVTSGKEMRELKMDHINAIYPHIAESEARNNAVGWNLNTQRTYVYKFNFKALILENINCE